MDLRLTLWVMALASVATAQQVPVMSLAGERFRVADLAKARDFYARVVGLRETKGTSKDFAVCEIMPGQNLEFVAGEAKDPLEILYFGVSGTPPAPMKDPEGHQVQFVHGGWIGALGSGISRHLLHVGMGVGDLARAQEFYSRFGGKEIFRRPDNQIVILKLTGSREDWVEFIVRQPQSSQDHICLDVPDIQRAYQTLVERGAELRGKPRIASNGYWVINIDRKSTR